MTVVGTRWMSALRCDTLRCGGRFTSALSNATAQRAAAAVEGWSSHRTRHGCFDYCAACTKKTNDAKPGPHRDPNGPQ